MKGAEIIAIGIIALLLFYSATNFYGLQMSSIQVSNIDLPSEIRGVFIFEGVYGYAHDWNVIAETLAEYGINNVFVNDQGTFNRRPDSEIRAAIDAFHAHGIKYHSVMAVLQDTKPPGDTSYGTEAIKYDGTVYSKWSHCPIKAHDYVLDAIRNYLNDFPDVDGIMLDFIRYADQAVVCYCDECKASFREWLGEEITDWARFYPNGDRYEEFLDWRNIPLTALVKDIHDTIKSINPNIVISEAAWSLFSDCPIYWRKWMGQDTAKWIAEGYIDFVAPMMYTKDLADLEGMIDTNIKYWLGGQPEGKVPLVAFLRNDFTSEDATPDQLKAEIDLVRSKGLDGWIIWRYGGPGSDAPYPDIREYLSIIDMPQTFTVKSLEVEPSEVGITVSWQTDIPTLASLEYSDNPLFVVSYDEWSGFPYWNIQYSPGMKVTENEPSIQHQLSILNVNPKKLYYFRLQCYNGSQILTSHVFTFQLETVQYTYPEWDDNAYNINAKLKNELKPHVVTKTVDAPPPIKVESITFENGTLTIKMNGTGIQTLTIYCGQYNRPPDIIEGAKIISYDNATALLDIEIQFASPKTISLTWITLTSGSSGQTTPPTEPPPPPELPTESTEFEMEFLIIIALVIGGVLCYVVLKKKKKRKA